MTKKLPKRPASHVIDSQATREFEHKCSPNWIINRPDNDYGWDRLIELKENDEATGDSFLVQIKGSSSPNYVHDKKFVSCSIKVSTISYLLKHNMPSMLCICDIDKEDKPIFWVWIRDRVKKIEEENPDWQKQKTISILIPLSQELNDKSHHRIECDVKQFHTEVNIANEIGTVISKPYGLISDIFSPSKNQIQTNQTQKIYAHLSEMGLVDATVDELAKVKPLSLKDQKTHREIKRSSEFLNSFFDQEAEKILNEISKEISSCSDSIKAKFYNNKGVLSLHSNNLYEAKKYFSKAENLEPKNIKYITNLLISEFLIALDSQDVLKELADDWLKRLDKVLAINENYPQAVYLKAQWTAEAKSVMEAEKLIKESKSWKEHILDSSVVLSEIFIKKGQFNKALKLYEELEAKDISKDERFWALYGNILFIKAVGKKNISPEMTLKGPGPSNINKSFLIRAENCYSNAISQFKIKGMPEVGEQTIANYTAVLSLLGKYKKSENICRLYLEYHPNSIPVLENLVSSLNFQNDQESIIDALQFALHAFSLQPESTRVYCNFILSLFSCEEFEEIINIVLQRDKDGFANDDEEGLSKALLAISYNELGFEDEFQKQIKLMKLEPHLFIDAILAETEVLKRNSVATDEILKILRDAQKKLQDDPRLLTKMTQILKTDDKNQAKEIITCLTKISKLRNLTPNEYSSLGKAFLGLDNPEEAQKTFYAAYSRYPEDIQFFYLAAISNYELGREEEAYKCLKEYLQKSNKDYQLLKNLALIARDIGKCEESAKFLEKALHKATNSEEKSEIHCMLYELKMRLGRPKKDILRHVEEYGKLHIEDVDAEARYLIMFMMAPQFNKDEIDLEVESWIKNFNKRLDTFSKEHPQYDALRTIKIPQDIPDDEKGQYILAELAYVTLPQRLAIAPFELAIKEQPFPLVFRAQVLPWTHSIFEFWSRCTESNNFAYSIHIWRPANDLESEKICATSSNTICVDINALLSLAELEQLNQLEKCFDRIILSRGTKLAIDLELASPFKCHTLAQEIEKWRLDNLKKIRIRSLKSYEVVVEGQDFIPTKREIMAKKERSLSEIIGDGVGESLLLAKKLDCPLYSDDSIIREWGTNNYNIRTFSTLSLLSRLMKEEHISLNQETSLYAEMISKNFRLVPFQPYHLTSRLIEIVNERKKQSLPSPKNKDLKNDSIFRIFLNQFGESSIAPLVRADLAINWWISILENKSWIRELAEECMEYISFCFSQITKSGVIKGIKKEENEHNVSLLWALFWWRCNLRNPNLSCFAWFAIKENCKRLFPTTEKKQDKILFKLIPMYVIEAIKKSDKLDQTEKLQNLYNLTKCFKSGEADKDRLEEAFAKHIH